LALPESAVPSDERGVEQRFIPGSVVEHADRRWRIDRARGADAVLLQGESGPPAVAHPGQVTFPNEPAETGAALGRPEAAQCTEAAWAEAVRRRDLVLRLVQRQERGSAEIDAIAAELGLERRSLRELLRLAQTRGPDAATFLPARHHVQQCGRAR
jgi:hypothetical protein